MSPVNGEQPKPSDLKWVAVKLDSFDAVPKVLPFPYKSFVLFLAADGRNVPSQTLQGLCEQLLAAGARYVCAWGPDCSRIHDLFDQAALRLGLNRDAAVVMTTWHDKEPLEEAVWFAANAAFPDETYGEATGVLVALSIGSDGWDTRIREYLNAGTPLLDEA